MIEFKIFPEYFEAVFSLKKSFEFRLDDKGAEVGDFLLLREWDKERGYTKRTIVRRITYKLNLSDWGSKGFILGFFGGHPCKI